MKSGATMSLEYKVSNYDYLLTAPMLLLLISSNIVISVQLSGIDAESILWTTQIPSQLESASWLDRALAHRYVIDQKWPILKAYTLRPSSTWRLCAHVELRPYSSSSYHKNGTVRENQLVVSSSSDTA